MSEFAWTARREQAALRVAEDSLSDEEIAQELGIVRRTLALWKACPEFQARSQAIVEASRVALEAEYIASKRIRLNILKDIHGRMEAVIRERAAAPDMQDVPGGKQGILVHQVKGIGKGEDFQVVDEYAVDTGLLKEMREWMKQAAQERGDWTEKSDVTSGGKPIKLVPWLPKPLPDDTGDDD